MFRLDLEAIRRDHPLPIIARNMVALRKVGSEWLGCCPFHTDRSPSFTVFDGGQRFHCFGCNASGDVLDFMQRAYGVSLPEAARMLANVEMPELAPAGCGPDPEAALRHDTGKVARVIWQRALPAAGTLGEAYLRFRGIVPPYPPDIRFLALPCDNLGPLPCLVLAVRDVDGEVTGMQRIFLAHDGQGKADIESPKRSLGRVKGGAIRLGDLDGSGTLTVCEGPEDGLSLLEMTGGPVWVAAGASFLPAMRFPPEVRSIVIGADNDPAGREAADKAAHAFADRGLTARIIRPVSWAKDFNDELTGAR